MFIKHTNQTHTKTHTPNAKYLQTRSDDIPQRIHHLLSSHRKQAPNAYIHFTAHRPTRTHDPMCSTSYYPSLVSQTSQPPIHQRFPLISFLCAHRPNLEKKTCRPRAVTPKEAHTPHSTPLSTVLSTQSTHKASFVDTCVTVLQTWKVGSNSIFSPQCLARPCCQAKQQELSRCARQDPTQVH